MAVRTVEAPDAVRTRTCGASRAMRAPDFPAKSGEIRVTDDPVSMYLEDLYTIAVNLAGLPGMSIPAGFSHGLPVGLQIIGNYFDEARMLGVGHQYQQATDWHTRMPEGM